jgi:lipopolysaccharide/colanic/teichoic acid biosynthesis glycosyltransferase
MKTNLSSTVDNDQRHDRDVISGSSTVSKDGIGELALRRGPKSKAIATYVASDCQISLGKRLFDIVGALAIGILALPLIVIISIAIRVTGSPVIFWHTRIGLNRKPFRCYKFRSMVPNAERRLREMLRSDPKALQEWRANHKLLEDPRITRLGNFLRKSSLDELPQLWNVLKGDMSLVGPRPIVADELERYGNKAQKYCSVRPGMTGLWQISGRNNVTYSRRVSLDVLYIRKQNLRVDCWVLWQTVFVVLSRIGAY